MADSATIIENYMINTVWFHENPENCNFKFITNLLRDCFFLEVKTPSTQLTCLDYVGVGGCGFIRFDWQGLGNISKQPIKSDSDSKLLNPDWCRKVWHHLFPTEPHPLQTCERKDKRQKYRNLSRVITKTNFGRKLCVYLGPHHECPIKVRNRLGKKVFRSFKNIFLRWHHL